MIAELHLSRVFKAITLIRSEQKHFDLETIPLTGIFRGVGGVKKIPTVGEVWISFGTTHCKL